MIEKTPELGIQNAKKTVVYYRQPTLRRMTEIFGKKFLKSFWKKKFLTLGRDFQLAQQILQRGQFTTDVIWRILRRRLRLPVGVSFRRRRILRRGLAILRDHHQKAFLVVISSNRIRIASHLMVEKALFFLRAVVGRITNGRFELYGFRR